MTKYFVIMSWYIISYDIFLLITAKLTGRDLLRLYRTDEFTAKRCEKNNYAVFRRVLLEEYDVEVTLNENAYELYKSYLNAAVYTYGSGLGHGDTNTRITPTKIKDYENVKQISCGKNHTAFITTSGEIYTFGKGEDGRLGHGDQNNRMLPTKITGYENVKQVSCSRWYTVFITTDGELYTFGNGIEVQLGYNDDDEKLVPSKLEGYENVKQVSCCVHHTAFIM